MFTIFKKNAHYVFKKNFIRSQKYFSCIRNVEYLKKVIMYLKDIDCATKNVIVY